MKKKILFVDDEPNILSGLKRMLRSQRNEWDMQFAEGGKAALEVMANESFDAVISDMRMPGMDGAQLLEEVKKLHPESVRFVLSGHSDQELVMRSVGPSHQYLSKPCEPDILVSTLADAFALREVLASDSLRTLVAGMTSLPSLPTVYTALVEKMQDEEASIKEVGAIVEQDPAISAKILQLVNSAYFGLGRSVSSPAEAANFLGMDVIKGLVMSEGVFSQFDPDTVKSLSLDKQRHTSLLVSSIARKIARDEDASQVEVDQAYLGGLLHDIGTLVLASNATAEFTRARDMAKEQDITICEAELAVFGTTHAEVGAYMLGLWGIDDTVVSAVAYHHHPENSPGTTFSPLTAVYAACTGIDNVSSEVPLDLSEVINTEYLEKIGMSDRIPVWQALCAEPQEDAA